LETTDENDILASNSENQQEAYELPVSEERPEAETADTGPDFPFRERMNGTGNSRWPETTTYKYTYQNPYGNGQSGRYPGQKVNKGTIESMIDQAANQPRYPNHNDRYDDRYGKQQGRYPGQSVPKGTVEGMIDQAAREQRYPKRNAGSYRENTRYVDDLIKQRRGYN
ncbi:unnamed protein product, partial [Mesorhabditis spiculigera]